MKAVFAGSAGFVGGNPVDELLVRGYDVTGVDRRSPSGQSGRFRARRLLGFVLQTDLHALVRSQVAAAKSLSLPVAT